MSVFRPPPVRGGGPPACLEVPDLLQKASLVYIGRGGVSKSLSPLYEGPYRVVKRSPKFFRVEIGDQVEAVSADRFKPHLGSSGVTPAVPPRCGRPGLRLSSSAGEPEGG
jgi:hypothetical protein